MLIDYMALMPSDEIPVLCPNDLTRFQLVRRKMDLHNWDSGINRDFGGHIGIRYL